MIKVIATIEVADGQREAFLAEFRQIIEPVRAEEGCIEYAPYIDLATPIDAQDDLRASAVVVVEKWESVAALEAHLAAPHMNVYREKVKDMVQGVSLQILEPAQ